MADNVDPKSIGDLPFSVETDVPCCEEVSIDSPDATPALETETESASGGGENDLQTADQVKSVINIGTQNEGGLLLSGLGQDTSDSESNSKAQEAVTAYNQGHYEEAIRLYTECIDLSKGDSDWLHAMRAGCFLKVNNIEQCFSDCRQALEINPVCGEAFLVKGRGHWGLGQFVEAATSLGRSSEIAYNAEFGFAECEVPLDSADVPSVDIVKLQLAQKISDYKRQEESHKILVQSLTEASKSNVELSTEVRNLREAKRKLDLKVAQLEENLKAILSSSEEEKNVAQTDLTSQLAAVSQDLILVREVKEELALQLAGLKLQLETRESQLAEMKREKKLIASHLSTANMNLQTMTSQRDTALTNCAQVRSELTGAEQQVECLTTQLQTAKTRETELSSHLAAQKRQVDDFTSRLAASKLQGDQLKVELSTAQGQLQASELQLCNSRALASHYEKRSVELEDALNQKEKDFHGLYQNYTSVHVGASNNDELEAKMVALDLHMKAMESARATLEADKIAFESKKDAHHVRYAKEIEKLTQELKTISEKYSKSKKTNMALTRALKASHKATDIHLSELTVESGADAGGSNVA